jgi:hypothetical protein
MHKEVMSPRSLKLEILSAVVACGALAYACGCLDEVEPPKPDAQPDPMSCCDMHPEGFGLEECVRDALNESDMIYTHDVFGCVLFDCPPVPDGVRWHTRVCP